MRNVQDVWKICMNYMKLYSTHVIHLHSFHILESSASSIHVYLLYTHTSASYVCVCNRLEQVRHIVLSYKHITRSNSSFCSLVLIIFVWEMRFYIHFIRSSVCIHYHMHFRSIFPTPIVFVQGFFGCCCCSGYDIQQILLQLLHPQNTHCEQITLPNTYENSRNLFLV